MAQQEKPHSGLLIKSKLQNLYPPEEEHLYYLDPKDSVVEFSSKPVRLIPRGQSRPEYKARSGDQEPTPPDK